MPNTYIAKIGTRIVKKTLSLSGALESLSQNSVNLVESGTACIYRKRDEEAEVLIAQFNLDGIEEPKNAPR